MTGNNVFFILGELVFGCLVLVLFMFIVFRFLQGMFKRMFPAVESMNLAFSIFTGGAFISMALLMAPNFEAFHSYLGLMEIGSEGNFAGAFFRLVAFNVLTLVFTMMIITIAVMVFTMLTTNVSEFKRMSENKVGPAVLLASLMISIALMLRSPLVSLISELFFDIPAEMIF